MKKLLLASVLLLSAAVHAFAQQPVDPCQLNVKTSTPVNLTANGLLFSGASARKNYICAVVLVLSGAETVSLIEGADSACASSPLALIGAATAASGLALPANGVLSAGNGAATIAAGSSTNFSVCLFKSGSNRVGGVVTYVQQ